MKKLILPFISVAFLFALVPAYAGGLGEPENLKIDQIACGEPGKNNAYATFSWDPVKFATSYRFYFKISDESTYQTYGEVLEAPSYKFSFNPQFEFNAAVSAVNTFTGEPPSTTESEKSKEVLLSAKKLLTQCAGTEVGGPSSNTQSAYSSPTPNPTPDQSRDQINDLEQRLGEVENRQSRLEKIVNQILHLLQKAWPF